MTYISCFSDFAFYFYYYFMENCHTWIIISMWQNDLHTNTSRSVWPILYGLMIKMLQYKMYPAGELAVLRQLLFLFLLKNLCCGYLLKVPQHRFSQKCWCASNEYLQYKLSWRNKKKSSRKHAYIILISFNHPLLYNKTGVYRGIHYFFYFC